MGASARLGTVEVGKEADLLLLRDDPLARALGRPGGDHPLRVVTRADH